MPPTPEEEENARLRAEDLARHHDEATHRWARGEQPRTPEERERFDVYTGYLTGGFEGTDIPVADLMDMPPPDVDQALEAYRDYKAQARDRFDQGQPSRYPIEERVYEGLAGNFRSAPPERQPSQRDAGSADRLSRIRDSLTRAMTVEEGEETATIPEEKLRTLVNAGALHGELDMVRQVRQGIIPPRSPEQIAVMAQSVDNKRRFLTALGEDPTAEVRTDMARQQLELETITDSAQGPIPRDYADAFEAVRRAQTGLAPPGKARPGDAQEGRQGRQHGRDRDTGVER